MLTNLNFLSAGASWPPRSEQARLERYRENERLFLTEHNQVWEDKFRQLGAKYKKKNIAVDTIINYHQLLSKKTADFVCSEPPKIETEGETDKLTKLLNAQRFNSKLYESILDVSRYGNGIIKHVGQRISAVSPQHWFPVVDPTDLKTITHHVIAYCTSPTELYAEIHTPGALEQQYYTVDPEKGQIVKPAKQFNPVSTGLTDFAVQVLTNLTHSGSVYGIDDYTIVNSLVSKIMWRLHCADTVLDKHSEPSMSGPESALSYDERTGRWFLDLGNYFKRGSSEDPDIKYVTWDGNLESNFKELDFLINQLYILTEMGQAFLDGSASGEASSGTALKLRMVSPRIKAQRIVGLNEATVKSIIHSLAQVNHIGVDYDTITIHWCDGLPKDEVEQVNLLTTATGGPIMSRYSALKRMGLTDDEVDAELEQMQVEEASGGPRVLSAIDSHADIEVTGGEDGDD